MKSVIVFPDMDSDPELSPQCVTWRNRMTDRRHKIYGDDGGEGRVFELKKNDKATRTLTTPAITRVNSLLTFVYENLPTMTPATKKMI